MSTTTANMLLEIPSVGDSSSTYPTSISTSLTNVDLHDHTTNKGIQIPTGGIANGAVTQAKRAALGQQVSSSCGAFTTSSVPLVDVTNLSVSITTTGRPVFIGLIGDAGFSSYIRITSGVAQISEMEIAILRGVTNIYQTIIGANPTPTALGDYYSYPPGMVHHIEVPAAGTYTYKIQAKVTSVDQVAALQNIKLIAYEL